MALAKAYGESNSTISDAASNTVDEATVSSTMPSITMEQYTDYPVLNVVEDNPVIGDEHKFLRIAEYSPDGVNAADYSAQESYTLEAGKSYILLVCLHNAAKPELDGVNDVKYPVAIIAFPEKMVAGETKPIAITISYGEEEVAIQGDQIEIVAQTNIKLVAADALDGLKDETIPSRVMQSFPEQEAYASLMPVESTVDDTTLQTLILPDIEPGYKNASYLFFRLDVK